MRKISNTLGIHFYGLDQTPEVKTQTLVKIKVGIYKSWIANMDEGWTRWVLEQHAFDLDTLHDQQIRKGDLMQYDAIIIPSQSQSGILHGYAKGNMPARNIPAVSDSMAW